MKISEEKKKLLGDLVELMNEEDFKKTLLKELNKEVDLPVLKEKQEAKLFKIVYKVILNFVEKKFLD
jgi:hemolysin-activating ACP:hemolysin acyltransferase|tara:strand:+ start:490 stop:690 length:201 start_codon:yes stop_codon:yes gene_type:complete